MTVRKSPSKADDAGKATPKTVALTAIRDLMDDAWSLDDTEVKDLQLVHSAIYQNLKDIERKVREGWPEPSASEAEKGGA